MGTGPGKSGGDKEEDWKQSVMRTGFIGRHRDMYTGKSNLQK